MSRIFWLYLPITLFLLILILIASESSKPVIEIKPVAPIKVSPLVPEPTPEEKPKILEPVVVEETSPLSTVNTKSIPVSEPIIAVVNKPSIDPNIKPSNVKEYIPPQSIQYFDIIKEEQEKIMKDFIYPYYFAGLIEHESCISLTHSKCWNMKSRLKTSREEGAGFFQLTKAYNKDGSIRFDVLSDLRRAHMQELKELSWSNVYQRPDLQIRAGIILTKQNYKALYTVSDTYERLAMADSAYNGGIAAVRKQRQICGLKSSCDPQRWFNNLETIIVKSTKPLYAGRSANDINKHHVKDVLKVRMSKYKKYFLHTTL